MSNARTVYVGLSGGVDSAVAAYRLKRAGYRVVGVFIKVWHPDFMVCNWEAERLDAMRVAAHLEIPFLTCDAEARYRDDVAQYFIEEYRRGRTPNPDVMCNKHVKFGAFIDFAKEAGADYIATGHYVRRVDVAGEAELHRGMDAGKDQSYFLWSLTREQLAYALFPIGDTTKDQIRKEAELCGLPVFAKKDSQGICFLGHVDIKDFLSHYIDLQPGNVLDEGGSIVGEHAGAVVYTIGQRHGFTLHNNTTASVPHYVVERDVASNTITVSTSRRIATDVHTHCVLENIVLRAPIVVGESLQVQTRYRQTPFEAEVVRYENDTLQLLPRGDYEVAATGQSCVLYRGDVCIGGGIIT